MTDTQTIETINAHLDEHPTDWVARLELADLLEEIGEEDRARYQRWAVEWERAPQVWDWLRVYCGQVRWHWWIGSEKDSTKHPEAVIGAAAGSLANYQSGADTRQRAEDELMLALIHKSWPDLPEVA